MYKPKNDPSVGSEQRKSSQQPNSLQTINSSTPLSSPSLYSGGSSNSSAEVKSLTQTGSSNNSSSSAHLEDSNLNLSEDMFRGNESQLSNNHIFHPPVSSDISKDLSCKDSKENSVCLDFELSQDFSQDGAMGVKQTREGGIKDGIEYGKCGFVGGKERGESTCENANGNHAPKKYNQETKPYLNNNSEPLFDRPSLVISPSDEKKTLIQNNKESIINKVKELMSSHQLSLEDLFEKDPSCSKFQGTIPTTTFQGTTPTTTFTSVKPATAITPQCKEKVACSKNLSINGQLFKGNQIFAKWKNDFFYPAIIESVDHEKQSLVALFEDGEKRECAVITEVILDKTFEKYQKVFVKCGERYQEADIRCCDLMDGEYMYWVHLDKKKSMSVDRSRLCFHNTHVKKEKIKLVRFAKPTRKRKFEPPSSSSSDVNVEKESKKRSCIIRPSDKLFAGHHFLLTKGQVSTATVTDTDNETSSSNELQLPPVFNEHLCIQTIQREGGMYVDVLTSRELKKANKVVCLTDITNVSESSSTVKFLYCIACGIPVVHFEWLLHSVEQRKVLSLASYKVAAGTDITGEKVEQSYDDHREKYTPLRMIRIYVHFGENFKPSMREFCYLLETVGCEVIAANLHVTKRTKRIPFDVHNVDYILSLTGNIPEQILATCKDTKIVFVTFEWLKQCVINNKLLDVVDSPLFTCK